MPKLDVNSFLGSYVTVDVTQSVAQALTKLRTDDKHFIMVTQEWNQQDVPVCVLREPALMRLASNGSQELSQLLGKCPPILTVNEGDLEDENLSDVLTILGRTKSPGLVVRMPDDSLRIVSRASVARAVPLEEIALVGAERGTISVGVPPRTYICHQCNPERRKIARVGPPPDCDVWSHGPMEEE